MNIKIGIEKEAHLKIIIQKKKKIIISMELNSNDSNDNSIDPEGTPYNNYEDIIYLVNESNENFLNSKSLIKYKVSL